MEFAKVSLPAHACVESEPAYDDPFFFFFFNTTMQKHEAHQLVLAATGWRELKLCSAELFTQPKSHTQKPRAGWPKDDRKFC
jgi:hypothetical protein